jgi:hypothetical protein
MKIVLCFLLSSLSLWSQETVKATKMSLHVILHNFDSQPPDCGIFITIGLYKATVTDFNKYALGEEILVYAVCREGFPDYIPMGKEITIFISENSYKFKEGLVFNLTGYTDEEIKYKKKYQLTYIQNSYGF